MERKMSAMAEAPRSEIRVLSTTALQTTLEALAPGFEQATGHALSFAFGPSGRMAKRVADGEQVDVAIVTGSGIDALVHDGRIVPGSRSDVAQSRIGLAVARGAPRPDLSTVEPFKQALLAARAIGMSNPKGGAQSGAHLAKVFEQLGIAEILQPKLLFGPGGPEGLIGNFLLRDEIDVGLQQIPELMAVPGIDIVGPIPPQVQLVTIFSAGLSTSARDVAAARAWIDHLRSPIAAAAIEAMGMSPA